MPRGSEHERARIRRSLGCLPTRFLRPSPQSSPEPPIACQAPRTPRAPFPVSSDARWNAWRTRHCSPGAGASPTTWGSGPGTAHAAVLRSPHAHAEIVSLDAAAALSMPGVVTVLTGEDVVAWSRAFIAGVKQPMRHYALAVDRVRYTGEPVAVVVARDRYAAEDALERIEVEYRELAPVVESGRRGCARRTAAAPRRRLERRERPALALRRP